MSKPPLSIIPGVGVMTDTLDFVKNLWGSMNMPGMNLPGMAAPTLSIEELDKKISDLKAVESWLNVNMTMLRGTIQALEVQRGTIATLKSVGASFSAIAKQEPGPETEKSLLESSPYASAFLYPNASGNAGSKARASSPEPTQSEAEHAQSEAGESGMASLTNPLAWWSGLQEQFKQAVSTTTVTDTMAKLSAAGTAIATDAVVKLGEAAAKSNMSTKTTKASSDSDKPPPKPRTKASSKPAGNNSSNSTGKSRNKKQT
jgi:hypothetical protein